MCVHHGRSTSKVRLGDLVTIPDSDLHHVMDPEAILAISHAIEDIAGEIRQGELIATFQDFKNFLPNKKRYMSLAEDLDAVRVWGSGEVPRNCGKIDFCPDRGRQAPALLARPFRQRGGPCRAFVQAGQPRDRV